MAIPPHFDSHLFSFGEATSHVDGLGSSLCIPTDSNGMMDVCHCSITNLKQAGIEPALCKTEVLSLMKLF